ncbi:MAG: HD domain-containing protein [bacterium]
MIDSDLQKILAFTHTLNKVKNIIRFKGMHGWENVPVGRWDSVAEHCFRLGFLVIMLAPRIKEKVNVERALKMALVHDLVEIIAEDFNPIFASNGAGGHAFNVDAYKEKVDRERAAAKIIFAELPDQEQLEYMSLWEDYAKTKSDPSHASPEGKFVYALDKIEAAIQIVDWAEHVTEWDYTNKSRAYTTAWSQYDEVVALFNNMVQDEMDQKAGR